MPIEHTKEFGVYHWDTVDNETFLVSEANTLDEALTYVHEIYEDQISSNGADKVDIVDSKGNVVETFKVS